MEPGTRVVTIRSERMVVLTHRYAVSGAVRPTSGAMSGRRVVTLVSAVEGAATCRPQNGLKTSAMRRHVVATHALQTRKGRTRQCGPLYPLRRLRRLTSAIPHNPRRAPMHRRGRHRSAWRNKTISEVNYTETADICRGKKAYLSTISRSRKEYLKGKCVEIKGI